MTAEAGPRAARPLRDLVIVLALVILTNGPILYVSRHILLQAPSWEDAFVRPMLIATALTALGLVALDTTRPAGQRLVRPSPVGAAAVVWFSAWAVLSSLWSVDPGLTRGRALLYVGLAALAWVIADRDLVAIRRVVLMTAAVGVGLSLVAVALSDAIALDRNDDWRGIFTNRNSLAPLAAIAAMLGVVEVVERRKAGRAAALALVVISLVTLYNTGSRTASFAFVIALSVATLVTGGRLVSRRYGRRGAAAVVAVAVCALLGVAIAVGQMWNEPTLAQRRTIWNIVWDKGAERPLEGHGFFAIWNDPDFTSTHSLLERGSAHGSFFETWLGLGLVGVVTFLVISVLALVGAVREAWRDPSTTTWAWLALVAFLATEHLTESFVLWFSYNWVLLTVAAMRSGIGARRAHDARTRRSTVEVTV